MNFMCNEIVRYGEFLWTTFQWLNFSSTAVKKKFNDKDSPCQSP